MDTRFEWDTTKARSNLAKHEISFEIAALVFDDPYAIVEQDRIEGGEYRCLAVGKAIGSLLLAVVHTTRDEDVEIIRIISARRAVRKERKAYERQFS